MHLKNWIFSSQTMESDFYDGLQDWWSVGVANAVDKKGMIDQRKQKVDIKNHAYV